MLDGIFLPGLLSLLWEGSTRAVVRACTPETLGQVPKAKTFNVETVCEEDRQPL